MPAALAFATTSFAGVAEGSPRTKAALLRAPPVFAGLAAAPGLGPDDAFRGFPRPLTAYTSWELSFRPASLAFATTCGPVMLAGCCRMKSLLLTFFDVFFAAMVGRLSLKGSDSSTGR